MPKKRRRSKKKPKHSVKLNIAVLHAKGLRQSDRADGGLGDPYVKIRFLDLRTPPLPGEGRKTLPFVCKTTVKKDTLNPKWREAFPTYAFDPRHVRLQFEVFDWDGSVKADADDNLDSFLGPCLPVPPRASPAAVDRAAAPGRGALPLLAPHNVAHAPQQPHPSPPSPARRSPLQA